MDFDRPETWPPGTVLLEKLDEADRTEIVLQPQPTEDPNDPLNWSKWEKGVNFGLVSFYTLMVYVILDIGTVIYGPLMDELGFSIETLNWSFGANTAGLAVGCILFIPFALKFGRRPIYLITLAICMACAIWQAKMTTAADQYGSNLVAGLAEAVSETLCQMTIADLFFVHQRATANGFYLLMVNVGTFLAPVAAGYSADSQGWRWIWWWTTIFLGVSLVGFVFFYEETKYTPVPSSTASATESSTLYVQKPSVITKATDGQKNNHAISVVASSSSQEAAKRKSYRERLSMTATSPGGFGTFFRHTYQPFVMLFTIPAVAYTAVIWGSLLAWFTITLSTLSEYLTMDPYNFSSSSIGLMNLSTFIGTVFGTVYAGYLSDWMIVYLAKRNKGVFEPEMRLWLALPAIIITPAGLALFGLSMAAGLPWIALAVGLAMFGFGLVTFGDVSITYLMDCYQDLVGDALVAVAFVRNAFATVMALALQPWIDAIGLQNVFVCVTLMAFAMFTTTIPMLIWGKTFRVKTRGQFEKMKARQFAVRT